MFYIKLDKKFQILREERKHMHIIKTIAIVPQG